MSVVKEFREFIAKGSVIDLAVGVIIGGAFGKIVTSLVDQVVMPPIGLLLGKVDFSDLKWVLAPEDAAAKTKEVAIQYGAFVNTVIQFLIVAIVIFAMVKLINNLRREEAAAPESAAGPDRHRSAADGNPRQPEGPGPPRPPLRLPRPRRRRGRASTDGWRSGRGSLERDGALSRPP